MAMTMRSRNQVHRGTLPIALAPWAVTALVLLVGPASLILAQQAPPERLDSSQRSRILEQARQAIERAKERRDGDEALEALKGRADSEQARKLQDIARQAISRESEGEDVEALRQASRSAAALRQAKEAVSPEAADIIRRSEAATQVAQATPSPPPRATDAGRSGSGGPVTVPPRVVKNTKDKPPPKGVTTITAKDGAYFTTGGPGQESAAPTGEMLAVFTGDVIVNHPSFIIESDQLEVFLEQSGDGKDGAAGAAKPAPAPNASAGGNTPEAPAETAIKKAIATGREVVIRKKTADGKLIIAKCRKATYFADTQKLKLEQWPQVQRDNILVIATEPSTQMILDTQTGHHEAIGGGVRTDFLKDEAKDGDQVTPSTSRSATTGN